MILSRQAASAWAWTIVATLLTLVVAACQHASTPSAARSSPRWQLLERVGEVGIETGGHPHAIDVGAGSGIPDGSRLTTGKAAQIILSRGDIQLTVGEATSLTLAGRGAPVALVQNQGWLRLRLSTAADRAAGVATPHLLVNGSRAVITLEVDADGTEVQVQSGSVALASADGQRQAQLAAGGSARAERRSGGRLIIRAAPDLPYSPAAPLQAAMPSPNAAKPKASIRVDPLPPEPASIAADGARTLSPAAQAGAKTMREDALAAATLHNGPYRVSRDALPVISPAPFRPAPGRRAGASAEPARSPSAAGAARVATDPLRAQFDRLTAGLTASLQPARRRSAGN